MCGIAGIINNSDKRVEEIIHKMTDAIAYRGPDDSGYLIDDNVALGHRRLSIIDLDNGHWCYDFQVEPAPGTLAINGGQWFSVDTPFGGYRQSGLGRENGRMGFEEYLETKVMALPVRRKK